MEDVISLAYGAGGQLYRKMVEQIFVPAYANSYISQLGDSAVCPGASDIAMTTDSFVINPLFFPGGDIGSLSVCGTVNDLSVSGAKPLYITVGMIIEAGFPVEKLKRIVNSIADTASRAGVYVVSGDTKVVESGKADGIYINTAGVGVFDSVHRPLTRKCMPGDVIICSGNVASHGTAVTVARSGMDFSPAPLSDEKPLNSLIDSVISSGVSVNAMRDPTRGGVACVLCEWVADEINIEIEPEKVPIAGNVKNILDILGMDFLNIANEGVVLMSVPETDADAVLEAMHSHPDGKDAAIIGKVVRGNGKVLSVSSYGTKRRIIMPAGEILPRIC